MIKGSDALIAALKRLKHEARLEKVIFFGSRTTRTYKPDSDIDLIIVSKRFNKQRPLKRAPSLYMKWNLDYPVDFLCYTPKEFEALKNKVTIVREAIQHGIEI